MRGLYEKENICVSNGVIPRARMDVTRWLEVLGRSRE